MRRARWSYIYNILNVSLEEKNSKPFWQFIKSQRKDNCGISALKSNGKLHTDSKTLADLCNKKFQSAFTQEDKSNIPKLPGPSFPTIDGLSISVEGVEKLQSLTLL